MDHEASFPTHRHKDRMKGKLEPLVTFGMFEVFSERAWQMTKEV